MTSVFMKGKRRHHSTAPDRGKTSWGNAAPSHWPPLFWLGTCPWPRHTADSRENEKRQVCCLSFGSGSGFSFCSTRKFLRSLYLFTCFDVDLCSHTICWKWEFIYLYLYLQFFSWLYSNFLKNLHFSRRLGSRRVQNCSLCCRRAQNPFARGWRGCLNPARQFMGG